jgi:acetylornithine/succinyldiaminopimelate/putrescine aminotransferase
MEMYSACYESKGGYGYNKKELYPIVSYEKFDGKLVDTFGNEYYDWMSGCCTCPWGVHPKIVETISWQSRKLIQYYDYLHEERLKLTQNFRAYMGSNSKVLYTVTGSQAVSLALRLALYNRPKATIAYMKNSYHGELYGSSILLNRESVDQFYPDITSQHFTKLETIDDIVEGSILIIEPYESANNGNYIRSKEELKYIIDMCKKRGIFVIFDEIQTGIGRTGDMFVCEKVQYRPDLLVVGKSIGNGLPISVVLMNTATVGDWEGPAYSSTFSANPIACAVGNTVFGLLKEDNVLGKIKEMGNYLRKVLQQAFDKENVQVEGLYGSVFVGSNPKILENTLKKGIILRYASERLLLTPKYTIEKKEIDKVVDILVSVCDRY